MKLVKEFWPAIRFILLFLSLYIGGNVFYSFFIKSYNPYPDPITQKIAENATLCLNWLGYNTIAVNNTQGPTVFLNAPVNAVLNIYEGCNGVNVMIVFVGFVVAFGGKLKRLVWFLPFGIIVIHIANVVRIVVLYFIAIDFNNYFYYFHKYIFTAVLYLIVFLLWYLWLVKINATPKSV